jgi:hypothetical protein
MQCYIQEHHLNQPLINYPHSTLHLNVNVWPQSVQDRFNEFCALKSINELKILCHHIVLRSFLGPFQLLTSKKNGYQGQFTFFFLS